MIKAIWFSIIICATNLFAQSKTTNNVMIPIKSENLLSEKSNFSTSVSRLKNAKIVYADYDLIRKDFPYLKEASEATIDAFLLDNAAYISDTQLNSRVNINSEIAVTNEQKVAIRPPSYGRALVFRTKGPDNEAGLIDAKGVGAISPGEGGHSNGLMTLGESVREYLFENLVRMILDAEDSKFSTVASYAVIDAGFDVIHDDSSRSRAGIYLRQAHLRSERHMSLLDDKTSVEVEKLLRKYGVTTAGAYRDLPVEKLNVQGTQDKRGLIDFGAYLVVDNLEKKNARNFFGNDVLIAYKDRNWVEIDDSIRVPHSWAGSNDPKTDNPFVWSHEFAKSFAEGKANRSDAKTHFDNMFNEFAQIHRSIVENRRHSSMKGCDNTFRKFTQMQN